MQQDPTQSSKAIVGRIKLTGIFKVNTRVYMLAVNIIHGHIAIGNHIEAIMDDKTHC